MANLFDIAVPCPRCRGEGKWMKEQTEGDPIWIDPCEFCNGSKYLPLYKINLTGLVNGLQDEFDTINSKLDDILDKLD